MDIRRFTHMSPSSPFKIIVLLVFFTLVQNGHAKDRERVALIIGNAAYQSQSLANPVNDATDMTKALRKLGFQVTLLTDTDHERMETAIRDFGDRLNRNTVGLFYYSGHGIQHEGNNYLVPIGSMKRVSAPEHLRFKTVDAGYVLGVMRQSGSGLNVIILDACRDNPFQSFSRSMTRGLARIPGAEGTLIAYSTAPGKVALDGHGRNSPYTRQLLSLIDQPNIPVELLLKKVRSQVKAETNGKQSPWYEASLDGDFYFTRDEQASSIETTRVVIVEERLPAPMHPQPPWIFPDSTERLLTNRELSRLNKGELWKARNEIFARRGYIFETDRGKAFAHTLAGWYHPRSKDSSAVYQEMSDFEQQNIQKIKSYERK